MQLSARIQLLTKLGKYIHTNGESWQQAKLQATAANGWFTPQFLDLAMQNIVTEYLNEGVLQAFAKQYNIPNKQPNPKTIGIVMAGNIPLVGIHDFVCALLSGHKLAIKLSEKDNVLLPHLISYVDTLSNFDEGNTSASNYITVQPMLKGCDAYITTGSNNSARYFAQYFGAYPHIIRRNRTSVAILTGTETEAQLQDLADDIHLYFGLGCRNVTKLYVPVNYNFEPLLQVSRRFAHFAHHHKYKNNYDYNLALHMLNKVYYMTNESLLVIENEGIFSPISQLNYSYYTNLADVAASLHNNPDVQCIVGNGNVPFGQAQQPSLTTFADGVDTMHFLTNL